MELKQIFRQLRRGEVLEQEIIELKVGTTVLGAFDELPHLNLGKQSISENAKMFCFTDGICETENENLEEFGTEISRARIESASKREDRGVRRLNRLGARLSLPESQFHGDGLLSVEASLDCDRLGILRDHARHRGGRVALQRVSTLTILRYFGGGSAPRTRTPPCLPALRRLVHGALG